MTTDSERKARRRAGNNRYKSTVARREALHRAQKKYFLTAKGQAAHRRAQDRVNARHRLEGAAQ